MWPRAHGCTARRESARDLTTYLRFVLLLDGHMPPKTPPRDLVAVCFAGDVSAVAGEGVSLTGSRGEIVAEVARMESERHPRWVFWSALAEASPMVSRGIHLDRCWDIAEVHRVLAGGRG